MTENQARSARELVVAHTVPAKSARPVTSVLIFVVFFYLAGWVVLYLTLKQVPSVAQPPLPLPAENEPAASVSQPGPPASRDTPEPSMVTQNQEPPAPSEGDQASAAAKTKEVIPPPGRKPTGVKLLGLDSFRCWDLGGVEQRTSKCDRLDHVARFLETRLYILDECHGPNSGPGSSGTLKFEIELDYEGRTVSLWKSAGTNMGNADYIVDCAEDRLSQIPLENKGQQYSRYLLRAEVEFKRTSQVFRQEIKSSREELARLVEQGRKIDVVRDRVRVRKAPVDGEILGKISSGVQVVLLEEDGEWCRVHTARGTVGWMVCWGLDL